MDKERAKKVDYDTRLQVVPETITKLYTTVDDPMPEMTTKEISNWLLEGDDDASH